MNKQLSNIARYIDRLKNDRRIFVFSVCLLIATTLWFLDALSKDYNTTLTYNVKYVNPPRNLFLANTPPPKIDLRVQAHGFTLMRHKLAFSFSPLLLDLTALSQNLDSTRNTVQVTSEGIIRRIDNQISKEISISEVAPRNIILQFDTLHSKVVPVKSNVTLNFKPQFNLNDTIQMEPDSVEIAGPAGLIDTITSLQTLPVTFNDLETSIKQNIRILHPDRISIYPDRVTLNVPVERFTEKKVTLPLQIRNMPAIANVKLFPAQVNVSFMVGLSNYDSVSASDFSAWVDYEQISSQNETLEVQVESKPQFIQLLKVSPASVEYLIETDNQIP